MYKTYYHTMLKNKRLMPFVIGKRLICWITFYICDEGEEDKYTRDNMWSIEEDNPNGNLCWIDHLITDHNSANPKLSYEVWRRFKAYIKKTFPNVVKIKWNHFNKKTSKLTRWICML